MRTLHIVLHRFVRKGLCCLGGPTLSRHPLTTDSVGCPSKGLIFYHYNKMDVIFSLKPAKKELTKGLTEKQMVQIMTRRKACIDKFRKTLRANMSGVEAEEPVPPKKPRKKTAKKEEVVAVEEPVPPKKPRKKTAKKEEPVAVEEPIAVVEEPVPPKKPRKKTAKKEEPVVIEEPVAVVEEPVPPKKPNKKEEPVVIEEPIAVVEEPVPPKKPRKKPNKKEKEM